jgi:glycosyltransferase involved in cell wall biosynthesis
VILCDADVDDLAQALRTVVEDAALRSRLGANARATALKYFDRQRMGGEVVSVYRDLVGASGR